MSVSSYSSINVYSKNLKGAWESLLVMAILSYHIQCMGPEDILAFGKPLGALALCTALVRTLVTYRILY